MASLSLSFLGPFQAFLNGKPVIGFDSNRTRALLIYLVVECGRPHSRETLAGLIWPGRPQSSAMNSLRTALAILRNAIGDHQAYPPFLLINHPLIQFNPESDCWIDVWELEKHTSVRHHSSVLSHDIHERSKPTTVGVLSSEDQISQVAQLYRGEFLEGFLLTSSPEFEEWVLVNREVYRQEALKALYTQAEAAQEQGHYEQALAYARRELEIEPWQEEAHRQVMELLALQGKRSAAISQYHICRKAIKAEFGVEPAAETNRLYEDILHGRVSVEANSKHDPAIQPPKHNLPAQLSRFVGREKEIAVLEGILQVPDCRLLTLLGMGGIGKTRLALEVVRKLLNRCRDGVWFVELASLSEPDLLPETIILALGIWMKPDKQPIDFLITYLKSRQLLLLLDNCEHLAENCAQLVELLLRSCPEIRILTTSRERLGCEGERLFPVQALSFPKTDPLPSIDACLRYEAVQLFVERIQESFPGFSVTETNVPAIARICQRLEGIPLALELAAARARILSIEQIAGRLEDCFHLLTQGSRTSLPHHQTLAAMMDWSYHLLTEPEQSLFRRLSVFADGWRLEAAEEICIGLLGKSGVRNEGTSSSFQILDLLSHLVDKSLVMVQRRENKESRFRLLETIRIYASERLRESGETNVVRNQHMDYFLRLAERVEPELRGPDQIAWLDYLEEEHSNLRAALEWSLENNPLAGLRLASSLVWFWHTRSHRIEGSEWLQRALTLEAKERNNQPLQPERAFIRAKALGVAGYLLRLSWDPRARSMFAESLALYQLLGVAGKTGVASVLLNQAVFEEDTQSKALVKKSLELYREAGDKFGIAECLTDLTEMESDYEQAKLLQEEVLALRREMGDQDGIAYALGVLGDLAFRRDAPEEAEALFEESLALFREIGNKYLITTVLLYLGVLALLRDDIGKATDQFAESLVLGREIGDKSEISRMLNYQGAAFLAHEDYQQAERITEKALALALEVGSQVQIGWSQYILGQGALVRADLTVAQKHLRAALKHFQNENESIGMVYAINSLAALAAIHHQMEQAVRLYGAVEHLYSSQIIRKLNLLPPDTWRIHSQPIHTKKYSDEFFIDNSPHLEPGYRTQLIASLQTKLGEPAFTATWTIGQSLSWEQVIQDALSIG